MRNDMRTEEQVKKIIEELEKLAKKVLQQKNKAIPRRPIVIEFCGSPKSGKTSCINSLDLFLRRNNFRTRVLTERASVCPVYDKNDPYFNLWTVTSVIAELSEILSNHPKDFDAVILDRGIFDALSWFAWQLKHKHLDENNYKAIESFLTMNRWRSVIDLVYVFTATPNISLEREYANLLTRKVGSIMHPKVLRSYNNTIEQTMEVYKSVFNKIEHIDTSNKKLNDVNYEVTKHILNIVHDNTSEMIGFLKQSTFKENLPQVFDFSKISNENLKLEFGVRKHVEASNEKVQPIPILVITNKERTKVLVVKKNRKQTSSKSPESKRILLYLGGHVRQEDLIESNGNDLLSVSRYALHREIKEEIGFDYYPHEEDVPFFIWVKSNDRSVKHIALCHVMEADFSVLKIKLDKNEFMTTGGTKSGKVHEISEINKMYSELEDWSQIILQKVFNFKPPAKEVRFL